MLSIREYIKKISIDLNYKVLLLFIFWLPLKDDYLPFILAIWIFTWLLEGNFKNRIRVFPKIPLYIALGFYFSLTLITIIYANDFESGFFHIQEKLSLVFFPLILAGSQQKIKGNYKTILAVFVLGNLIAALYCLLNALFTNLVIENNHIFVKYWTYDIFKEKSFWTLIHDRYNVFSYSDLSFFKHPSYFSMYLLFSICILYYFIREKMIKMRLKKLAIYFLIFCFTIIIYLLQSRAGIISFVIILILITIIEIHKTMKKRYLIVIFLSSLLLFFVIAINSRINKNIIELKEAYTNPDHISLSNSDARFQVWYISIQVIKENFWFGTSPSNLTDQLVIKYKEYGFNKAAEVQLNSHNQYLETFAGLGIFGFLSLMFILIYGIVISLKKNNYLLFFLLLILSINFLFESMLNRMAGVLFMMFFMSLLVFANIPEFEGKSTVNLPDK